MKVVNVIGGLGNQMFQYALFIALKNRFPYEEILLDASLMSSYGIHNGLELTRVFGLEIPQASFRRLLKLTYPAYNYRISRLFDKFLPVRKTELRDISSPDLLLKIFSEGDRYYKGYWLDYRYYYDIQPLLQSVFQFKCPHNEKTDKLLSALRITDNTVSIHIRRGDYLKAKNYIGLCGHEYYSSAINYITENVKSPQFIIFSDDIDWCKNNMSALIAGYEVVYVDWNSGKDSPLDMLLMSSCHHNIIANSTFSWWGAALNSHLDKIVCAPKIWTNNKSYCKFQMPEWKLF